MSERLKVAASAGAGATAGYAATTTGAVKAIGILGSAAAGVGTAGVVVAGAVVGLAAFGLFKLIVGGK